MEPVWFEFYPETAKEMLRATRDLGAAIWNLRDRLRLEYSKEVTQEATKVPEEAARKIEDITKKSRK